VNKTELIDLVVSKTDLDKKSAASAVEAVIDGVVVTIKGGDKVSLLGFGTFNPTSRAARIGRNPQTGAPVKIAASKGVRFAPGVAFKTALNAKSATAKKVSPAKKAASAKSAGVKKASVAKKVSAKKAAPATKKK
jgi:DNA-binding protein HU-beta